MQAKGSGRIAAALQGDNVVARTGTMRESRTGTIPQHEARSGTMRHSRTGTVLHVSTRVRTRTTRQSTLIRQRGQSTFSRF